jgi:AcrR family transcriptional regulator
VKDICRAAGLSDRYFYESFAGGAELFIAVFDRANEHVFGVVSSAVAEAGPDPETQGRAGLEAFVRELAGDPRLARIVFVEAPSAGAEAEQHRRATLRRFAEFAVANARPLLPRRVPEASVQMAALSFVGAIERVMIEWQDGHLEATIEQIVDHLTGMFLTIGAAAGITRPPARRGRRSS